MKRYLLSFVFLLSCLALFAQPQIPDYGKVFNDQEVPRIDITINPDTLSWIYDNPDSDIEFHADFFFTSSELEEGFEDVGFRLRGNTSRHAAKKSFKVSFNTFVDGGDFEGFEKLNLNGEHNDPSVSRSKISWDLARQLGLPSSRANHVELYINGNYYGLYLNVEHIDEEYTKDYYDTKNGNLYKCLWPADLAWKGSDPNAYKEEFSGRRAYDLKINEDLDDYTDIRDFIDALNNSSQSDFFYNLQETFNTQDYLKYMALEITLGHWDDYIYNKNNYYLYHNPLTDQFEFILYDLDNTMGIDWMGINWATRNIYNWGPSWEGRPLYDNIMNNNILRDQFTYYIQEIADIISSSNFETQITNLQSLIRPSLINDPFYPMDYGYSINDFDNSFTQAIGDHVTNGIIPFFQQRGSTIHSQAENTDMHPVLKYVSHNAPGAFSSFRVSVFAEDNSDNMSVQLVYRIGDGEEQYVELFDDGLHGDYLDGDKFYGGSINPVGYASTIYWNILATDNASQESWFYREPMELDIMEGGDYPIYINEIMADNETTISDEYGEYEDWIELWNGGEQQVDLGGLYLSDNPDQPNQWMLPDVTLNPGEFVLIWADKDEEQGELHANFKLSKEGEFVGLYDVEASGYALIDDISFGSQTDDISFGREEDGAQNWITFAEPTPGSSNEASSINNFSMATMTIFPVPAHNSLYISSVIPDSDYDLHIYNATGQLVETIQLSESITKLNISNYAPGVYFIVDTNKQIRKFIKQ